MATRLVLYFTASDHLLYRWSRRGLDFEAKFTADDLGVDEFRRYLQGRVGALVYVVADLSGEDFHEDQIPYLRGADRQAVVERRIAQRYRDTRLAAALSLGYVKDERRNERLLLASFTNTQQFVPWLEALAEAGAKLSGVYSVPVLAPALAARLGTRGRNCLVVTVNRAGLRQCYVEDGRLRFARLERTVEMDPEALAAFARAETLRIVQYLATLRAVPREGPSIQVVVVAPDEQRAIFERTLASDSRLAFRVLGMKEAARKVRLGSLVPGAGAEQLFLHLSARAAPKEQFARREERRTFILWKLQRAIVGAGAFVFAACVAYAGFEWYNVYDTRGKIEAQQRDAQDATQQYQRITATFPVPQASTELLKAAVAEFNGIAARTAPPETALAYVSHALDQFPRIELDSLTWAIERPDARAAKPAAVPAEKPAVVGELAQVLEISGRVVGIQRSDYRSVTGEVQRFADTLAADRAWHLVRKQLPFDVTPDGVLSGDIGEAAESSEAPRFTIVVARNLK